MTDDQLKVLSESPAFTGLEPGEIEIILHGHHFQIKEYAKGTVIAQSGSGCEHARVVLEGRVAGEMMDLSGKVLKIEDIEPSKMIAPAFLYGRRRNYPVNVIASEFTILWQMHRSDFSKLLQADLRLLDNYLNAISNRAQFLSEKIRFLSFPTLRAKLAFFLVRYSADKPEFKLPMTHQQLSELFGVARPSLSREIRQMNVDGIIESERDMVKILDFKRLRSLLNEN